MFLFSFLLLFFFIIACFVCLFETRNVYRSELKTLVYADLQLFNTTKVTVVSNPSASASQVLGLQAETHCHTELKTCFRKMSTNETSAITGFGRQDVEGYHKFKTNLVCTASSRSV